jgi:hypothetical protein
MDVGGALIPPAKRGSGKANIRDILNGILCSVDGC